MSTKSITLSRQHLPSVDAGKYILEVASQNNLVQDTTIRTEIIVKGYQHYLPDHEILSTYPMREAEGSYKSVIPHVEFRRSTLPWDYKVTWQNSNERVPYIFLVILKEDEVIDMEAYNSTLNKGQVVNYPLSKLAQAIPENQRDFFTMLHISANIRGYVPSPSDVKNLAYVKTNAPASSQDDVPEYTSILLANRILQPNTRYKAFICSYTQLNNNVYTIPTKIGIATSLNLLVLNSWNFESTIDTAYQVNETKLKDLFENVTFDASIHHPICNNEHEIVRYINNLPAKYQPLKSTLLITNTLQPLNKSTLLEALKYEGKTLKAMLKDLSFGPWKSTHRYQANSLLNHLKLWGKVPLAHNLKGGGKLISWYQGPLSFLSPSISAATSTPKQIMDSFLDQLCSDQYLPDHPDKLIWYNEQSKMLDMTYAAAWQLGRLLLINNTKATQELKKWKDIIRQKKILEKQNRNNHILRLTTMLKTESLPDPIMDFLRDVLTFKSIPYYYMTPHESLLPEESIRYFKIDNKWILALLMGIFSAGNLYTLEDFRNKILSNRSVKNLFNYEHEYFGIIWNSYIPTYFPYIKVTHSNQANFNFTYNLNQKVRLYLSKTRFTKVNIFMENEHMSYGINTQYNTTLESFSTQTAANNEVYTNFANSPALQLSVPYDLLHKAPNLQLLITSVANQIADDYIGELPSK